MKLSQAQASSTETVAVVGLSGSGKSTLVAELSKEFRLHWFDLEHGKSTLLKLPPEQQDNIELYAIKDSATYPIAAETLLQVFKNQKGTICHAHSKFNCALCKKDSAPVDEFDFTALDPAKDIVVVDTASQLSSSILAHLMKGKSVDAKPERDEWGGLRKHTEFMAAQFQAASFNLVVICHAVEAELEDGKKKLVPNFGSAGMSATFAKNFGHVIYCDIINKKHKAFSSSVHSGGILTKSRTDFEIEKLPEPSLIPLFKKERGNAGMVIVSSSAASIPTAPAIKPVLSPGAQALANLREKK